jgi:hypothetical protein
VSQELGENRLKYCISQIRIMPIFASLPFCNCNTNLPNRGLGVKVGAVEGGDRKIHFLGGKFVKND